MSKAVVLDHNERNRSMASKDFVYDHQYLNLVTDGQPMEQLQNKANMYVALGHYNYN